MSVVVFPEGARSFTGHMGKFRRGAFMLADELQLPVCPLTINGSFDVMPRTKDWHFPVWHRLSLTIHKPIFPKGKGTEFEKETLNKAYDSVMAGLFSRIPRFRREPRPIKIDKKLVSIIFLYYICPIKTKIYDKR